MDSTMDTGSPSLQEHNGEDEESANVGAVGGTRPRRRTEKGKAYIAHVRWTDCHSLQRKVSRKIEQINPLMENVENVNIVEKDLAAFRVTCEELKRAFADLLNDLESDERLNVANDWYAEQNSRISNFIETTECWILSAKATIEQDLESSSTTSKRTGSSKRSRASTKSSVSSGRAKERAKAAELMAKAAILERKQALEQKTERLRLEEQLAVAQARERAYAEVESGVAEGKSEQDLSNATTSNFQPQYPSNAFYLQEIPASEPPLPVASSAQFPSTVTTATNVPSTASTYTYNVPLVQQPPNPTPYPQLNPMAPEFRVNMQPRDSRQNASFHDILIQQSKLTEMLLKQHQQSLLPSLTITKFSGDPLEYSTFVRSFDDQIETKVSSNDVRLRYLEQYLEGEPKEIIKGCLHLDKRIGYPEAKKLLREKYGDPYKISNAYIKKITEWPCIRLGDDMGLDRFSTFLTQCQSAMSVLPFLNILDHPHNMQSMVKKLPLPFQERWRREANKSRVANGTIPVFADFVKFVKAEAGIATDPVFSREALSRLRLEGSDHSNKSSGASKHKGTGDHTGVMNYATMIASEPEIENHKPVVSCKLCEEDHDLDDCEAFMKKTLQDRKQFLKEKELCFACYDPSHRSNGCAQRRTCKRCSRRHPTGLHDDNFRLSQAAGKRQSPPDKSRDAVVNAYVEMNETSCNVVGVGNSVTAVPIVPVRLKGPRSEVYTYAMLDGCSTGTFVLEDVAASLDIKGVDTKLMVKTVNGTMLHDTKVLNGLIVTDLDGSNCFQLPKTFVKDDISGTEEDLPTPEIVKRWKHLSHIASELPPRLPGAKIGLLIGSNCPKALEPLDIVASKDGGPFAIKTFAGWAVVGPLYMSNQEHDMVSCNRIVTQEAGSRRHFEHHFMVENKVQELLTPKALNKMFELDFNERSDENRQEYSQEDNKFITIVNDGIQRTNDNHYEIPLPFRSDDVSFPDNREQVVQRAHWLKKKFRRDDKFYNDYVKFMNEVIAKGYASKVRRISAKRGKVWYIPHHGVYHPKKPGKIRVVFDCSARFGGTSLNDQLLQGPDLTNCLVGVLTRFRQEPIAFMADIEGMFHQVRVPEGQRDFLRFLWWSDGDLLRDLEEYQMNVHLFGAVSSPSCSNFALRRAGKDAEEQVGAETADVLKKNFYVDDCLRSEGTEESAIRRIHGVRSACAHGGFNLTKFVSNRRNVLETVPHESRAQEVKRLDLNSDSLPVERALGVQWAVESDTLGFRIILKDKPFTRRGVLSTICSVYDPLGIAAPFLLVGKKILQDLCRMKLGWDEEIGDEFRIRWENWRSQLSALENFSMNRCLKPDGFGPVTSRQIHSFSDASSTGYGQVTYLRIENDKGDIHCALLIGKARLAPIKTMTIPRLELTAATVSVRVGEMITRELDDPVDSVTYWTDSTTVLKYIRNETKRFHVFVANRVQEIRDKTNPNQWKYVETKNNPADDASRGLKGFELSKQHRWIRGPDFLWLPETEWPQLPGDLNDVPIDDPEIKKVAAYNTVIQERADILGRLSRFSDWNRMKRCIALILRLKPRLANAESSRNTLKLDRQPLTVEELKRAEETVLKLVQSCVFAKEIEALRRIQQGDGRNVRQVEKAKKSEIKKSSTLYRLDPFLDRNGLMRVGGRLSKSQELSEDLKHPIILPKDSFIVNLILRDAHEKVAHAGRGITLSALRSQYWILHANSVVRHFISKCVVCRRLRSPVGEQKMADLPKERTTPAPPFTYCGVDYFGPFYIKAGRKELKRYGVLFTCLSCRAVHIETANSLETDSFLNALRRFIARRGPVREIRSDQGTNIVGAEKELKKAVKEMDHDLIQTRVSRDSNADWVPVKWKQNPPAASHMGGVWERQIRSVRSILTALLREHGRTLDDESFRTLLTEVECIINSRPLTTPTSDPEDLDPLTPNHILTMKSKVVMPPPGNFQKADVYLRKRWKRVQYLSNVFWSRWRKEYIQCLQQRVKWNRPRRNFEKGDVILIADDRSTRNDWPMARVIDTHPDSEGQVRSVTLTTGKTILDRPISKIVLLLENDE